MYASSIMHLLCIYVLYLHSFLILFLSFSVGIKLIFKFLGILNSSNRVLFHFGTFLSSQHGAIKGFNQKGVRVPKWVPTEWHYAIGRAYTIGASDNSFNGDQFLFARHVVKCKLCQKVVYFLWFIRFYY